jgi:hypothetical protein
MKYPLYGDPVEIDWEGPDNCYRLVVKVTWNNNLKYIMGLLKNPSMANEEESDRTLN